MGMSKNLYNWKVERLLRESHRIFSEHPTFLDEALLECVIKNVIHRYAELGAEGYDEYIDTLCEMLKQKAEAEKL